MSKAKKEEEKKTTTKKGEQLEIAYQSSPSQHCDKKQSNKRN